MAWQSVNLEEFNEYLYYGMLVGGNKQVSVGLVLHAVCFLVVVSSRLDCLGP